MLNTIKKLALVTFMALISTQAMAFKDDTLVIWMGGERGQAGWKKLGQKFEKEFGVKVVIEEPDPLTDKFVQAASTGDGPDLVFWAHDRFGEWANSGLIAPVRPRKALKDGVSDFAWDAVAMNGKTWGYPIFVESIALLYNKKLLPTPPASFEEIARGLKLPKKASPILWDYNNAYFSFPLLMANGGYAFEKNGTKYNEKKTGVTTPGAIAGGKMLKELIDRKVMPAGADYGVMDAAFSKGEVAMIINGPWSWKGYQQAGIDFGVAPLPSINGKPAKPFVGVYALGVNAASPNKDLIAEFIEKFVLTDEGLKVLAQNGLNGAMVDKSYAATMTDPKLIATLDIAKNGVTMPNTPAMGKFWSAMQPALANITGGQQTVEQALADAAKRITAK